jgi:hypothetical protein
LPKQLVTLIDHENKAVTISAFEAIFVPGLLASAEIRWWVDRCLCA